MNKTQVEKALYIKGFRHSGRIFDTVLIPNRIINNGRNVGSCRYFCKKHINDVDNVRKMDYNIIIKDI